MSTTLRVFALGGLGEVGLNLTVLECGDDILIVDCGVLFPDLYWMGLDLILPDFTYLIENDKKRLREIGKKKPVLLLSDSTNSERCGHSESESTINEELEKLVKATPGAAIVALFASNVHRIHQLMDIADRLGRKVFLSGRSM